MRAPHDGRLSTLASPSEHVLGGAGEDCPAAGHCIRMDRRAERVARFTVLFERHYDAVSGYARRRTDSVSAADVAAETFLVAWRRIDDVPLDALPWLLVTARKTLANQRRSNERASSLRVRLAGERQLVSDSGESVADDLTTHRRWVAAFGSLDTADQEVLALTAWDGLTVAQAAAVLGCGVSACAMRLHRARRRLRRALEEPVRGRTLPRLLPPLAEPEGPER